MFLILQKYTIIRKNVHFPCIYFIRWGVAVGAILESRGLSMWNSGTFYEEFRDFLHEIR